MVVHTFIVAMVSRTEVHAELKYKLMDICKGVRLRTRYRKKHTKTRRQMPDGEMQQTL